MYTQKKIDITWNFETYFGKYFVHHLPYPALQKIQNVIGLLSHGLIEFFRFCFCLSLLLKRAHGAGEAGFCVLEWTVPGLVISMSLLKPRKGDIFAASLRQPPPAFRELVELSEITEKPGRSLWKRRSKTERFCFKWNVLIFTEWLVAAVMSSVRSTMHVRGLRWAPMSIPVLIWGQVCEWLVCSSTLQKAERPSMTWCSVTLRPT